MLLRFLFFILFLITFGLETAIPEYLSGKKMAP